ncbi:hypothetical protein, partial [Colwellia sp.]|uniref:hypothetical protein n=1 Tax=Colwellia sp. TaxID=56799 RepID=UPI00345CE446
LLPINFIVRHQAKLLFIVVWGHVTILDLCYVTYSGPIFFLQESLQLFTIITHLTVAALTLVFYFMLINIMTRFRASNTPKQASNSSPY